MTTLNSSTSLIRNPDLIATDMDGDTVMMGVDRGEYYGIGGVGSRVWALLAQPISIDQITKVICAEYDVDASICQADVQKFAQELLQDKLVSLA